MENQSEHFRHILLFYYRKSKNAVQAIKKLCAVYWDILSECQCQNWFSKFCSGNFDLKDTPRSDRPIEADDKIKVLVDANRNTTREIAEKLIYRIRLFTIIWNAFNSFQSWMFGFHTIWRKLTWFNALPSAIHYWNVKQMIHFWSEL